MIHLGQKNPISGDPWKNIINIISLMDLGASGTLLATNDVVYKKKEIKL